MNDECLACKLLELSDEQLYCMVALKCEPAKRMLRTEAQALQRQTKYTHDWFDPVEIAGVVIMAFNGEGTYTYAPKATIKLDGKMVTPEQAAAEWEAKKEAHDCIHIDRGIPAEIENPAFEGLVSNNEEYEIRPKQPAWTGSREDVIGLLKELGFMHKDAGGAV